MALRNLLQNPLPVGHRQIPDNLVTWEAGIMWIVPLKGSRGRSKDEEDITSPLKTMDGSAQICEGQLMASLLGVSYS